MVVFLVCKRKKVFIVWLRKQNKMYYDNFIKKVASELAGEYRNIVVLLFSLYC